MRVLDLFSGIGGFSLGLERAGMETVAFCEIEEFPRKVLQKHWPEVPIYDDVRQLTAERLRADGITPIDLVCGGFPCQDISTCGKQAGIKEGTRSGLWSECARLLREVRPNYAIFENVTALLSGDEGRWFQRILWDISKVGYDAEWHCIPASELGAHHHRDRVWIIAYSTKKRYASELLKKEHFKNMGHFSKAPLLLHTSIWNDNVRDNRSLRDDDGFPEMLGQLNGYGNAVVPQIPEIIGRVIMEIERENQDR